MDIRIAQALLQFTFLMIGVVYLNFPITVLDLALAIGFSLLVQKFWDRRLQRPYNWMSALPSALSLLLLLRVTEIWLWPVAATICISSKFILRYNKVHLFNPSALTLLFFLVLGHDYGWVSPGQWGQVSLFCFILRPFSMVKTYPVGMVILSCGQ